MKIRTRSVTCLGFVALCVGIWFQSPVTAEEIGFDFWNLGELEDQISRGEVRNREIDRNDQQILSRMALRQEILKNLIAEKITLEEAGRGFLALNQTEPAAIGYLRIMYPNGTDLDRAIYQVVIQMNVSQHPGSRECHEVLKCEVLAICSHIIR
ncbi:hypothetical protein [Zavarzinella formosa]|uniref:hypothetical protein n=1 Tax=Zavarzinella formosa TaxID=360055 RepID=UPI0002D58F0A|nr:hypothetical protein [Zavarzinella formosa]